MAWIKYNRTTPLGERLNNAVNYYYLAQAQIESLNDTVTSMTDAEIEEEFGVATGEVASFRSLMNLFDQNLEGAKAQQRDLA